MPQIQSISQAQFKRLKPNVESNYLREIVQIN